MKKRVKFRKIAGLIVINLFINFFVITTCYGSIVFEDNFNDGDFQGWKVSTGSWAVENGELNGIGWGGGIDAWIYAGDDNWTDYVLEAKIIFVTGNAELVFRSTGHWQNEYRFSLWSQDSPAYTNRFVLMRYKNGVGTYLTRNLPDAQDGSALSPVPITNPAYAKVEVTGNRIRLFVNAQLIYEIEDPDPLPNGKIGLGVIWDWQGQFDDIVVQSSNNPPNAICKDITVIADGSCKANASIDDGSYDPDGDPITIIQDPPGPYPLGTTSVTLTVTDDKGASDSCTATVTVVDTTPPDISLSVTPKILWPPNHKMILITPTITVTDDQDLAPTVVLTSITMNEGYETNIYHPSYDSTLGDGHTLNDIQIDENGNIYLRAERSGTGSGRIYTITYTATDSSGNSSSASTTVTVPHDQHT